MMQVLDWLSDYDDRMKEKVVKRSVINSEDVSKLCMDSFYQVYKDTGNPPRLLIIGQDKWFELTGGDAFNWRGTAPIDIAIRDDGYDGRFNGIPVQVVPYINGAFCLPDIK